MIVCHPSSMYVHRPNINCIHDSLHSMSYIVQAFITYTYIITSTVYQL